MKVHYHKKNWKLKSSNKAFNLISYIYIVKCHLKGSYDAFSNINILYICCNRICWHALMFKKKKHTHKTLCCDPPSLYLSRTRLDARICILHVFTVWFEWKKKHPCIKAATEERMLHNLQNGATVTRRDREETNCWKKFIFIFFVYKKYSRSFIKWDSQWDSHKPPGFYPQYFKLCPKDEQSFYGVETTCG